MLCYSLQAKSISVKTYKSDEPKKDPCALNVKDTTFSVPKEIGMTPLRTHEELLSILETVVKNKVYMGKARVEVDKKIEWKRGVIETLLGIYQKVVSDTHVPSEFLYTAREIIMMYLNVAASENAEIVGDAKQWKHLRQKLESCENGLEEIPFKTIGDVVRII
jgi:hypothetical protein